MSHRRQKMSRQEFLPSSHCCPVYPVTHWQLKEPHSPWQRPRWPQDGKPMLTQLLSVVRQPGELDWDSAGLPRSYTWGEVIEGGMGDWTLWGSQKLPLDVQHSFFIWPECCALVLFKENHFLLSYFIQLNVATLESVRAHREEQEQKQDWLVMPRSWQKAFTNGATCWTFKQLLNL